MIERYVFIKLNAEYASEHGRRAVVDRTRALAALPGVLELRVGVPTEAAGSKSWDVSIAVRFADVAAFERYRLDPDHRAYVDEFLAPRLEVIKAWNFELA
jgi:hypothetical protein